MKQLFCLLVLVMLVMLGALGCTTPSDERLGTSRSALTSLDTRPSNVAFASFGEGGLPAVGQVVTVPAVDVFLKGFGFELDTVPETVVFRGEVYAWDGTKATGPNLYESGPVSTSGPTVQTISFDTGRLALTAGAQYVLFITTSKDVSTGSGNWGTRTDNPYAGGTWVNFPSTPDLWGSQAWNANAGYDAAFTATFDGPLATATAVATSGTPTVFGESVTFTATVTSSSGTPAGTVTFKDGAATIGTAALNGAGQASLATSALSVATHSITAVYGGSANHATSTSAAISQVVDRSSTLTALGSSVNPSIAGGSVTFTATVTAVAPGAGTPSGTVTFRDGLATLGTVAMNASGVATFTTSTLIVGSHDIGAHYDADTRFSASNSPSVTQVVNLDGATVAVASSLNPSTFGASVTFTATVSSNGSGGVPTGSVNFKDGAAVLGTGMLNGAGVATFSTSALPAGSHAITADYGGDTKHSAASAMLTQQVNAAASTTVSASLTNPSVFGQSVTFTAKVTGAGGTPSGNVTFLDNGSALNTTALNGAGQASFSTSALAVGTHPITISYAGDANFAAGTSNTTSQVVNKAATKTVVISSSNPSIVGASVTFTATVSTTAPGAGTATGTVTFKDGAATLGTGTLDGSGVATFSTSSLAAGTHVITASYATTASFAASSSANLSQVINPDGVSASLVTSLSPSTFGTSVTFTATVISAGPGGTPTGTVTFKDGATALGTAMLDAGGVASFSTAALTGGSHSITAAYGGDAKHATANATVSQIVVAAATSIALASSINPSVFGQAVTITATVTSGAAGTRTGTVAFMDGATALGNGAVNAAGVATLTTGALAVATHPISGVYSGDTNFATSTSAALSQDVGHAASSIAVVTSSTPSLVNTSVTFTATVKAKAPGAGTPSGTVTFNDNGNPLGTGTLNGSGVATFAVATLTAGAHTITADYGGDGSFDPSTSPSLAQSVSASAATMTLSSSPNPSTFGKATTLTAKVAGASGTPTGSVTFKDGVTELGTSPLDGAAVATLSVTTLPAGMHTITARYSGSTTYAWVIGSVAHVVDKAKTSTALVSSLDPSVFGDDVKLTATVTSEAAGSAGDVEFLEGTTSLAVVPLAGGSASFSTKKLAQGGHAIVATYKGNASFAASTSPMLDQTVKAPLRVGGVSGPEADPSASGNGGGDPGACGCRVTAPAPLGGAALFGLAGLLGLVVRRRLRRRI